MGNSPGWTYGFVPTAQQWNAEFAAKQDDLGFTPVNRAGDTMAGPLTASASTAAKSGFSIVPGTAPSTPENGDVWITSLGLFYRADNVTYGPISSGTVDSVGLDAPAEFAVGNSPITGSGSITLAWEDQGAGVFFAGPSTGPADTPSFRAMSVADLPATVARTDVVNTFTKSQNWAKGANIASAATLVIGDDGNYFTVTGTTGISALSSASAVAGTCILLKFASALTLTNGASLVLNHGSNYVTSANDLAIAVYDGAGVWRLSVISQRSSGGLLAPPTVVTASGNYTPTAGTQLTIFRLVGGGGGGGGATSSSSVARVASGGDAGSLVDHYIANPSGTYPMVIGAGGAGGAAGDNNGSSGGTTTISTASATGGVGGLSSSTSASDQAAIGYATRGSPPSGNISSAYGQRGGVGTKLSAVVRVAGNGGGIVGIGTGGDGSSRNATTTSANGSAGLGYGAGGGGGASSTTVDASGGNGAPGIIFYWEYS